MLPHLSFVRTACIQATRPHFHIETGAEQDQGDPHAIRARCTCANLLVGAASVWNVDTSVVIYGMLVGGGVAVMSTF